MAKVTLRQKLSFHAPGLTGRDVLDKLGTIMMIDVRIPTAGCWKCGDTAGRKWNTG
jgi:hypothetical protein